MSPAGQGDDKATFLADFRTLRDRAAIDCEELAARAHFPTDIIKAAESGPDLPGLPVLAAYVRACGGDVLEWEERWRRLASDAGIDSGLPTRPAGASPAAVAGARAGVTIAATEAHDPERIKAALRAHREREELAGHGRMAAHKDTRPAGGITTPAGGPATMIANGNHHKKPHPDGFNAWQTPAPQDADNPAGDPAAHAWSVPPEPSGESSWAREPSTLAPDPPAWTQEPPALAQTPPAVEEVRQVAGSAKTADATGTAAGWATSATSRSGAANPPVAAIRAASETGASRVTVAQAAAATSASRRGKGSGHRGLLVLVVLVVIIGCIALLSLTLFSGG